MSGGLLPGLRLAPGLKDGEHVGVRIDAEGLGDALERLRLAPCEASFQALESLGTDPGGDGYFWAPETSSQPEKLGGGW